MKLAGVEGGGTKFVAVVGRPGAIEDRLVVPTTTPEHTLGPLADFLAAHAPAALGLACFGPLSIDPARPDFGRLLGTPKARWAGVDVLGALRGAHGWPARVDTDVNGAALAEAASARGAARVSWLTSRWARASGSGCSSTGSPYMACCTPKPVT